MKVNYERSFYQTMADGATGSSAVVVPLILEYVTPTSIVDVGCGPGGWLAEFRRHGIEDVLGIDGPWVDPAMLEIPKERFPTHRFPTISAAASLATWIPDSRL